MSSLSRPLTKGKPEKLIVEQVGCSQNAISKCINIKLRRREPSTEMAVDSTGLLTKNIFKIKKNFIGEVRNSRLRVESVH